MNTRTALIEGFLSKAGWDGAERHVITGDASNRRYERLIDPALGHAVLMDADPKRGEDVHPFVEIANYLSKIGLSAPEVYSADERAGLLLLEDLGDDLYARIVKKKPAFEQRLYFAAVDVLVHIQRQDSLPNVVVFDPHNMTQMTDLAFQWYLGGEECDWRRGYEDFSTIFVDILTQHLTEKSVLALRDYHAENLIWLEEREGHQQVGLLDFQDAVLADPVYDLVSLLEDARRNVPDHIVAATKTYYQEKIGARKKSFEAAYAVMGAQRNLRILGIFARLSKEMGKSQYVDLIPRVYQHLMRNLDHPALIPVAGLLKETLPEPTFEKLQALRHHD